MQTKTAYYTVLAESATRQDGLPVWKAVFNCQAIIGVDRLHERAEAIAEKFGVQCCLYVHGKQEEEFISVFGEGQLAVHQSTASIVRFARTWRAKE